MSLCSHDKCKWYSDPSKYGHKCYYEPQCWRGLVDIFFTFLWKGIKKLWPIWVAIATLLIAAILYYTYIIYIVFSSISFDIALVR